MMDIDLKMIPIRDIVKGYRDDAEEGIYGYDGKLNIRPKYQREFVYGEKERNAVIQTISSGFPLNTMYWAKTDDGRYELMDGQQRTISICRYAAESERTFAVDEKYYFNLEKDLQKQIDDYVLDIYVCDGTPSEVHEWFKVINIAGKPLTAQELRNTAYTDVLDTAGMYLGVIGGAPRYNQAVRCDIAVVLDAAGLYNGAVGHASR